MPTCLATGQWQGMCSEFDSAFEVRAQIPRSKNVLGRWFNPSLMTCMLIKLLNQGKTN